MKLHAVGGKAAPTSIGDLKLEARVTHLCAPYQSRFCRDDKRVSAKIPAAYLFSIHCPNFAFNSSIPSPFAAETGTMSIFGNRLRRVCKFSAAFGKSILLATTNHFLSESLAS